jgi:hypothetical protein
MNLDVWAERLESFYGREIKKIHEKNGVFYAWRGENELFLPKSLNEDLINSKAEIWCIYQNIFETAVDKTIRSMVVIENKDYIHISANDNNEIKSITYHFYAKNTVLSNEFKKKSQKHNEAVLFVEKFFIDMAPNRLEFITGIN